MWVVMTTGICFDQSIYLFIWKDMPLKFIPSSNYYSNVIACWLATWLDRKKRILLPSNKRTVSFPIASVGTFTDILDALRPNLFKGFLVHWYANTTAYLESVKPFVTCGKVFSGWRHFESYQKSVSLAKECSLRWQTEVITSSQPSGSTSWLNSLGSKLLWIQLFWVYFSLVCVLCMLCVCLWVCMYVREWVCVVCMCEGCVCMCEGVVCE